MEEKQPKLPENTGELQKKPSHRFRKGESGNPAGRPKESVSLLTILKRQLQEIPKGLSSEERKQKAELLVKRQLDKAITEGDNEQIRLIWNYVEGKPKESVDITSGGKVIPILGGIAKKK